MYNNHRCVAVDPCHFEESAEVPLYKLNHGRYPISDEEKEHSEATSVTDMEFKKRIADISMENTASVHESSLNFSLPSKISQGTEALENGKRPSNGFFDELVNKRVKIEDQAGKLRQFEGNSPINITSEERPFLDAVDCKIAPSVVNAGVLFFPGYEYLHRAGFDQLEDVQAPLWEHYHRRRIPIGPDHQADLPQWSRRDLKSSGSRFDFYAAHSVVGSSAVIESDEVSADKWLGTCVIPMPPRLHSMAMEIPLCRSKEDCDCADEGSIRCARQHMMEARSKLEGALGKTKFMELGFPDMGEDVAQRWSEEEENLFQMIVLSNPASAGRNFWTVLPRNFPSRTFKEIVSYYFNVFVLRKRADQNRTDPLNADSDNDEWQEISDGEFETSEEEEEEDEEEENSAVESPADGNSFAPNDDPSEELDVDDEIDDEEEHEKHLVGAEDEGFYCGSGGSTGYDKPMPPREQPIDQNSRDCSLDQDVQDDSCTSFEGPGNVSDSCVERDREYSHVEHRKNDCMIGFTDYDYIDEPRDSKSWEINYAGSTEKDFDFFPTCNVLEEVFGKGI